MCTYLKISDLLQLIVDFCAWMWAATTTSNHRNDFECLWYTKCLI